MHDEKLPLLSSSAPSNKQNYVLVIHGGAGTMTREGSTPEQQALYRQALKAALAAGNRVLRDGGEAMDAAVAAVSAMEDCPLFNSGHGAVFNVDGKNELETSIMLSQPPATPENIPPTRRCFALTLLTHIRNPSQLVRALYLSPDAAPHAMLSGAAAESLCEDKSIIVDPSYFFTKKRWIEHRRGLGLPEHPFPPGHKDESDDFPRDWDQSPTGTVGAVALDARGCIATVTSTGGRTNKLVGRVGDTPLCGAGFWAEEWRADNGPWYERLFPWHSRTSSKRSVGISCTGDGDYFIRLSAASTVAHRMRFLKEDLSSAADAVIQDLKDVGGDGGLIGLDGQGNVVMPLNCPGMYRGVVRADGLPKTAIFADDVLS